MDETLREHLVREHGRRGHELFGVPLDAVHRLDHVDQDAGMVELEHTHLDG